MSVAVSAGSNNPTQEAAADRPGRARRAPESPAIAGPVAEYERSRQLLDRECDPIPFAKLGGMKLKYQAKLAASPIRAAMRPIEAAVLREIIEAAACSEGTAHHAGLLRYADRRLILRAWIGVRALADRLGSCSERTVIRALKRLGPGPGGLGLIARERRYGSSSWTIVELPADWGTLEALPQEAAPAAAERPAAVPSSNDAAAVEQDDPQQQHAQELREAAAVIAKIGPAAAADAAGCPVEGDKLARRSGQIVTSNVTKWRDVVSSGISLQGKNSDTEQQQQRQTVSIRSAEQERPRTAAASEPAAGPGADDAAVAARRRALGNLGIGNPKLTQLAMLDVSPERIAAIGADCKRRGKGTGVMILEIEAEAQKPKEPGRDEQHAAHVSEVLESVAARIIEHLPPDAMRRAVEIYSERRGCTLDPATAAASREFRDWISDPAEILALDDHGLISEIGDAIIVGASDRVRNAIENSARTHKLSAPILAIYRVVGQVFDHADAAERAEESPLYTEFVRMYPAMDRGNPAAGARAWHASKLEGAVGLLAISRLESWVKHWAACREEKRFVRVPTIERFLLDRCHETMPGNEQDRRTAVVYNPEPGTAEERRQKRAEIKAMLAAEAERQAIEAKCSDELKHFEGLARRIETLIQNANGLRRSTIPNLEGRIAKHSALTPEKRAEADREHRESQWRRADEAATVEEHLRQLIARHKQTAEDQIAEARALWDKLPEAAAAYLAKGGLQSTHDRIMTIFERGSK